MAGPPNAVDEFANTFKEWHYFVGGFSIGFVLGWIAHSLYSLVRY